jgi:hypothetical protein
MASLVSLNKHMDFYIFKYLLIYCLSKFKHEKCSDFFFKFASLLMMLHPSNSEVELVYRKTFESENMSHACG